MKNVIEYISALTPKKILIWILIIAIFAYVINNLIKKDTTHNLKSKILGTKTTDGTKVKELTNETKGKLQTVAVMLNEYVNGYYSGAEKALLLSKINDLSDAEFIYMYEFYEQEHNVSAYCDVDWEILPFTDEDEKFLNRAKKLRLKIKESGITESC